MASSEKETDGPAVDDVVGYFDTARDAVRREVVPYPRAGVTRDAEVDEEFADVEAKAAHDPDVAVVEADPEQLRGTAVLGVRDAEQCAAEQTQHPELKSQLDGDFEPFGAQRQAAAPGVPGIFGPHGVVDEGVIQLRLQVEVPVMPSSPNVKRKPKKL